MGNSGRLTADPVTIEVFPSRKLDQDLNPHKGRESLNLFLQTLLGRQSLALTECPTNFVPHQLSKVDQITQDSDDLPSASLECSLKVYILTRRPQKPRGLSI